MTILLSALGVPFAAFCVRLTVRFVNRTERLAKWTLAAVLALPLLYLLSFGPACWWLSAPCNIDLGNALDTVSAPTVYGPIGGIASLARENGWPSIDDIIDRYTTFGLKARNVIVYGEGSVTVFRCR